MVKGKSLHHIRGRFVNFQLTLALPHPQALNRYAYVRNNPINYTDPTGHLRVPFLDRAADSFRERTRLDEANDWAHRVAERGRYYLEELDEFMYRVETKYDLNIEDASIGTTCDGSGECQLGGPPAYPDPFAMTDRQLDLLAQANPQIGMGLALGIRGANMGGETSLLLTLGVQAIPVLLAPCPGGDLNACASAYGSIGPMASFTIPELIAGAASFEVKKNLINVWRSGGFNEAMRWFKGLTVDAKITVEVEKGLQRANVPGVGEVILRESSKTGPTTLEIQRRGTGMLDIKVRFPE